ncbi:uncharacterized protein B0H18DRAFT_956956 [Fomitopsis serialis]|uniref:uncharacterized protein n=1 Tax=Fomitopsis serialis TaxID=139415 RepID=UPI0020086AE8|nr:uncharacterized protein B0H18DRAFT_956956 [Neoantrodia serialis]KAH9920697.1 hypothetical protein B0H18DRAFT_956956 [Neoantrodia serialis]
MSAISDVVPTVEASSREALSILEADITDTAIAVDSALLQHLISKFERILNDFHDKYSGEDMQNLFLGLSERSLSLSTLQTQASDERDVRVPRRLQSHIERLISLESESDYLRLQVEHSSASLSMLFMPQDAARQLFIRPLIDLPEDFTQGLAEAGKVLSDINRMTVERRRLRNEMVTLLNRASAELAAADDGPPQPARNGIIQQHFAQLRGIRQVLTTQREQLEVLKKMLVIEFDSLVATPKFLRDQAGTPISVVDLRTALQAFIDLCRGARAHSRGCDRAISHSEELLDLLNRGTYED